MTRLVAFLAIAFVLYSVWRADAQEAGRTVIGVDVSGSSTFLHDQLSADAAGGFVKSYIAGLDHPHGLTLISVGDAGIGPRIIHIRATVTANRASSARKLAPEFEGYLRSLPSLVRDGKIAEQGTTSLVDFFHSLEPVCAAGNASVILFSDGIEWSSTVDGRDFVTGKIGLPQPDRRFLAGCEIRLLGVGNVRRQMSSGGLEARLVPQWREFLTAAGGEPITVSGSGFAY
ncbi:hypothetical protein [Neoaquamicrobium sediminum]|uniref:hypothetical protein n=1 Tax=Neoaquamicrobium sediminum TaxID=1849104 RepID=UPI003BA8AABD